MTHRASTVLVTVCVLSGLCFASVVLALDAPPKPLREQLTVRLDFEKDANENNYPDDDEWRLLVGRHHLQNIRQHLDSTVRSAGARSLRIEPDGVATVFETAQTFRYDGRFSYRLTGKVRTEGVPATGLRATSARLELVGLARDGKTEVLTARTEGVTGTTAWKEVVLDLPRDADLSYDKVRLRCVVDGIAIGGKVWFDEIVLSPRPSMRIGGGDPDGCFSPDAVKQAVVAMHTLIDGNYTVKAKLTGPVGQTVTLKALEVTPRLGYLADVKIDLPLATYGSYRLHLELSDGRHVRSTASRALLYWPARAGGHVSRAWGVDAGSVYRLDRARTDLLSKSRFGTVALELFSDADPPDNETSAPALRSAAQLGRLRQQQAEPILVLGHVPAEIVNRLFKDRRIVKAADASWLRTLSLDPKYWSKKVTAAVQPFASRVVHFQIGRTADAKVSAAELTRAVKQLREALGPVTYELKIGVVFDGTESPEQVSAASVCDFIVLDCSAGTPAEARLPDLVTRLKTGVKEVWVSLATSAQTLAWPADADRLVSRMTLARSAGADRVTLRLLAPGIRGIEQNPSASFSAATTIAREIGGRAPAGLLTTNVRAFLFTDGTDARLVVLPPGRAPDAVYLGSNLRRIDPDGNVEPVRLVEGKTPLAGSGRPFVLSGLALDAVLTRLSLTVGPVYAPDGRLHAAVRKQRLSVSLTSRFAAALTGTIEVLPPPGWQIDRSHASLLLEPGQPAGFQTDLSVPVTEEAGEHTMLFRLKLAGRQMLVARKVVLAPRGLETVVSVVPTRDGGVTVSQKVTNRDNRDARLALFVVTADAGRMERFANGIAPGGSTEVSFKLDRVTSDRLWIGWRETSSGPRFFNRYVSLSQADR